MKSIHHIITVSSDDVGSLEEYMAAPCYRRVLED
jgi:hypothetical protein